MFKALRRRVGLPYAALNSPPTPRLDPPNHQAVRHTHDFANKRHYYRLIDRKRLTNYVLEMPRQ